MRLSEATEKEAVGPEGDRLGPVEDALIDIAGGHLRYWRIDIGGGAAHAPVLIGPHKTRVEGAAIAVSVDRPTLDAARAKAQDAREDPMLDLQYLPDVVTGPFGYSVGPSMMGALMNAWRSKHGAEPIAKPEDAPDSWIWGRELIGKPLFGAGGEFGTIRDCLLSPGDDWALDGLEVERSGGAVQTVPASALRHVSGDGGHVVAHISSEGLPLEGAPWEAR